jgi:hypothetical protein
MTNLTNRQLHKLACEYGGRSLHWRNKFIGLLPELYRRRVFEDYGFGSIFEYAAKLAGLSQEQVRRRLNIEKKTEKLPEIKKALASGEISMNKMARVISIATPENEAELVEKVKLLPQAALEVMVRDFNIQNGLDKAKIKPKSVRAHGLQLSDEVTTKLLELHNKGLDLNELLMEFLEKREQALEEEKTAVAAELTQTQSRYIPVAVRRVIEKEYGDKCSMPSCGRPSVDLHHTQRFSLVQRHDPRFIAPLCKSHHTLAHAVDGRVHEKRTEALRCA